MRLNQCILRVLIGTLISTAQWPNPARAQNYSTNFVESADIEAIVNDLKDERKQWGAVSRLDDVITLWHGTNFENFAPTVEPLMPLIGWGGIARMGSEQAADILAKIHSVSLPSLIQATKSSEPRLRWTSARILGVIRPVESNTVDALMALIHDKDTEVRQNCFRALAGFGNQISNTIPLLFEGTNDPDMTIRIGIYTDLVKLTGQASPYVSLIASCLTNVDHWVPETAASSLGDCGLLASNTYPQLIHALKTGEPQLRINAADALGKTGAKNPEVVAALLKALEGDSAQEVRRSSAVSLGNIGPAASNAVPALIKILREANPEKRGNTTGWWVAATALGGIGGQDAIKGLEEAQNSGDPDIRLSARRALQKLNEQK